MGSVGLGFAREAQAKKAARKQFRQTRSQAAFQRGREEEALGGLRGELSRVSDTRKIRERAGLEDLTRRFDLQRTQIQRDLTRRGLPGQVPRALQQQRLAQAASETDLIRRTFLQDESTRRGLLGQIAGLSFQQPPSLAAGLGLTGVQSQASIASSQALNQAVGNLVSLIGSLAGTGGIGGTAQSFAKAGNINQSTAASIPLGV